MPLDQSPGSETRPGHMAVLPMKQLPRFTPDELLNAVARVLSGTDAVLRLEPNLTSLEPLFSPGVFWSRPKAPPTVGITINGVTVAVSGQDRPAFSAVEISRLDVTHWPRARTALARARAHVEVAEVRGRLSPDLDQNHDRAVAVTVVAAAVARLVDTMGIVWGASRCCLPGEDIPELVAHLTEGTPPVALWLGCEAVPTRAGRAAGFTTRGLYALLGAEIEVAQSSLPSDQALDFALEMAEQVITAGVPPMHGSVVRYGPGRDFTVRHLPRGAGNDTPALVLIPCAELALAGAA